MDIREKYNVLLDKEYKFSLINEVNELKERCILENNKEYIYKCNIMIADIYIEYQNFTEALDVLLKDIKTIDKVVFKNIYLDYLDRLIYLYINKRNYHVAIRYIHDKEKQLQFDDVDSLNRLYLEYSYAYGEMNKLEEAEMYLNRILESNPIDSLKSVVLSNLTKIYIDKNDIIKAKDYLNQCLLYCVDHESEVYCDYLLAKICILEGKAKDALHIFESIFVNEDINSMTLAMMNDYLKLLNNLKKYDKSLLLMNKLSLFINATNDLEIINDFYHNKLDYFIATKDNNNITITMKEIDDIEKQISENEKQLLNTNFEDDKQNLEEKTKEEAFNKVDLLTSLVDTAVKGNTIREIIMDFSQKVQKIIEFDELQFVLFNKIDEKEYQITDDILCLKYKNKRLYEKNIEYEDLKNSIVEMMVNNNKPVIFDLETANFEIKNIFTKELYNKEECRFLNSVPCLYKDDTFAAVIFSSKNIDLTEHSNVVLIKIASKLLETALTIQFINDHKNHLEQMNEFIVSEHNIGLFHINNDTMYLSDSLQQLFNLKYNTISVDKFIKKIARADYNKYLETRNCDKKYSIKYKYEINDKIVELIETGEPVTDLNGKILYYQGTIKSLENSGSSYALTERDLKDKIFELKQKANAIEFRFSFIKIKGTVDEYLNIKNTFGVEPYYLKDESFIVILENEINQRTLDKLIKDYSSRSAIVRYPRDIMNIEDIIGIANLMLENNCLYFSSNMYRGYIKRTNVINKIEKLLDKELKLISLAFDTYDEDEIFEIKPLIYGVSEKENYYRYVSKDLLEKLENKFIDTLVDNLSDKNCFFNLTNNSIYKVLTEYDNEKFASVFFVMNEYNKLTPIIIDKLKEMNRQIYIDYTLVNKLDAYYFTTGVIKGVYIDEDIKVDINKILMILNMFNLSLLCYNDVYDYDKICCYNNCNKVINN